MRTLIQTWLLVSLFSLVSCEAKQQSFVYGEECRDYVDIYISFHEKMVDENYSNKEEVVTDYLLVESSVLDDVDAMKLLVNSYLVHESEIISIDEFFARCKLEQKYASLKFKITDRDSKFSRLYVVIDNHKIVTISKELSKTSDNFDGGKKFESMWSDSIEKNQETNGVRLD